MKAEEALSHHVCLVIDNEGGSYELRREYVRGFIDENDADRPWILGDQLKCWIEDMTLSHDLSILQREILTTALAYVDWEQIARDYIQEERENEERN